MMLSYDECSPSFKRVIDSIELALEDVRILSKNQWDKEFDFKGAIWMSALHKLYFKQKKNKFKYWSKVIIDREEYLIPGIFEHTTLIYRTKEIIDYNVIVKL